MDRIVHYQFRLEEPQPAVSFLCCQKQVNFEEHTITQQWMRIPTLYTPPMSGHPDRNHQAILQLYWASLRKHQLTTERTQLETFLLASLTPYGRRIGSRRVFLDSVLSTRLQQAAANQRRTSCSDTFSSAQGKYDPDVEEQLSLANANRCSQEEFAKGCWALLGRADLSERQSQTYREMADQLLARPCNLLSQGKQQEAMTVLLGTWNQWLKSFGRTSGHAAEKLILDVLSYEARAAFHFCYSNTWITLLSQLEKEKKLTPIEKTFHQFWHTAPFLPNDQGPMFGGHVFGLHPAGGLFLQTPTGCGLIGRWLRNPDERKPYEELLNGLLVALSVYWQRHSEQRNRQPKPKQLAGDETPSWSLPRKSSLLSDDDDDLNH